ncbi:Crossover junction endonuclease MUS81 [Escovopsis weberi]|uniref:Crossover junction endonuclease MUS81 n=1 Tax=Escovopsis weberi TaxID=150374 RepID=A0A0M8N5Q4_ESCWE|nr:Crossover junction endonuclease MUS81 [Escovopsis weberi]
MDDSECANPLLLSWVKEWLDTARQQNSKGAIVYKHAYDSLKACPITIDHPSSLQQLRGFGPKLCDRLKKKMEEHCRQNGLPMPTRSRGKRAAGAAADQDAMESEDDSQPKTKKPRKPRAYVPAFRSGAYALLIGLATYPEGTSAGMTKSELIEVAQPHCDASFTAPADATKFYTAWNSIKTLEQKELVYERGRPLKRYALTDEGWAVVNRMKQTDQWRAANGGSGDPEEHGGKRAQSPLSLASASRSAERSPSLEVVEPAVRLAEPTTSPYEHVVSQGRAISGDGDLPSFHPIKLPPGSFTVELLLDVREVRAKTDRDYMQDELAKRGVKPIMRSLELGDVQWIAKVRDPALLSRSGAEGDEVVLDWIVERKRLDDLIGSIKDGRFHEQKFRLKRSGVQKVVYIIEEISMDSLAYQRYEEAVLSAIASTQLVDGYFVKRTLKMDDTIKYLVRLTAMLKRTYENKQLNVIPTRHLTAQNYPRLLQRAREQDPSVGHYITYPAFASLASKSESMTLRDVFLKMLMTTRGLTGERALEIQRKWKTPNEFIKAFESCGSGESGKKRKQELLATEMAHLVGRKKFTKQLSQKMAETWGDA